MQVFTIPVTPFMQNCRVIVCPETQTAAIVDPGGEPEKIISQLNTLGLVPSMILLTHAHLDHVGASTALSEHFNIEIIGPHQDDQFWLDALPMQSQMFGFPNHAAFLPSQWLKGGDNICLGNLELEVRHCPGHTPGHVVFYEPSSKQVLVGDVLFKGSVGRTDFPKGDATELKQSIEDKLFTLPDEVIVHSGHGENTSIGFEKATNPFMSGRFG
ncbi:MULTISPECIES: MBL fold metallo-hydrolase [Pseudoalteromonas]|uniref:MBL fold metallo-hydrolase n=1 Tax=Pseudoalteromonas TaxID=53246 RepID=UPI000FFF2FC6|nr:MULTISPECIES: MBL fold metallo-hydrolase [Pseudoalteromonas]MCG9759483.1 MBL fold metallo-hydrolase [Pseudoalteromonas sp. Isolate6]NKC18546.1 MBL fold metallo-hydrolase [Pseudoalteromonas galatheae]RXE84920.1 MBL fold metallo-hydrolase [Pseudoalteromonas sp. A757]